VCLHSDGKVYKCSSTYTNVVGIAIDAVTAGDSVRAIVVGVAQAVADGAINPGDRVTFSTATPGRVVAYTGHSHGVSTSTGTAVTSVSKSTTSVVGSVGKSTGSAVTSVSVDRRDFALKWVVTAVSTSTGSAVTSVSLPSHSHVSWKFVSGIQTSLKHDHAGTVTPDYPPESLRYYHAVYDGAGNSTGLWIWDTGSVSGKTLNTNSVSITPSVSTDNFVKGVSTTREQVVSGVTSTAGDDVVVNVTASTGTFVTDVSTTSKTVVSNISVSTGSFLTNVSVSPAVGRVIGIALTGASAAGETVNILVIPMVL